MGVTLLCCFAIYWGAGFMAASENLEGQYIFMGNQGGPAHSGEEEEVGVERAQPWRSSSSEFKDHCGWYLLAL